MTLIVATYISATSFVCPNDLTEVLTPGRRLRCDCGTDGLKICLVVSASYESSTTVVVSGASLTTNLAGFAYSVVSTESLPAHTHEAADLPSGFATPVITWLGDQIAFDGLVSGPNLTGPVGAKGDTGEKGDTGAAGPSGGTTDTDTATGSVYNFSAVGDLVRKMLAADTATAKLGSTQFGGTGAWSILGTTATLSGGANTFANLVDNNNATTVNINSALSDLAFTFNHLTRVTSLYCTAYMNGTASGQLLYLDYQNASGAWVNIGTKAWQNSAFLLTFACDVQAMALRLRYPYSGQTCYILELAMDVQVSVLKYIKATDNTNPVIGIAVSSTSVVRRGEVQLTGETFTLGARQYVSSAGVLTETYAAGLQCFGVAIATDTLRIEPDMGVIPTGTYASGTHSHTATDLPATMPPSAHTHELSVSTKTAAYTATAFDDVLLCNAAAGSFAITLPLASVAAKRVLNIKKTDASLYVVTVTASGSDKIDAASGYPLSVQYQSVTLVSDGTNWNIL